MCSALYLYDLSKRNTVMVYLDLTIILNDISSIVVSLKQFFLKLLFFNNNDVKVNFKQVC